jgi:hypothetical protein
MNKSLNDLYQKLKNQSIHSGLIVNEPKKEEEKTGLNDIDIDSSYLEQVKSYKYLGSILS